MAGSTLPFFVRDKEHLKVFVADAAREGEVVAHDEAPFPLPCPKAASWSPDGFLLAVADAAQGVLVLELSAAMKDVQLLPVEGSSKTTQGFLWSPQGSALVTTFPAAKGSQDPNIHIWQRDGSGNFVCAASFCHPKLERDKKVLQWTNDESLCARLCPDGHVDILDGNALDGVPLLDVTLGLSVQNFEFAPSRARGSSKAKLAVFVADVRDDMQRVIGAAEVTVWEFTGGGGVIVIVCLFVRS